MGHVGFYTEAVNDGVETHQGGLQAQFEHEAQDGEPEGGVAQVAETVDDDVEGVGVGPDAQRVRVLDEGNGACVAFRLRDEGEQEVEVLHARERLHRGHFVKESDGAVDV